MGEASHHGQEAHNILPWPSRYTGLCFQIFRHFFLVFCINDVLDFVGLRSGVIGFGKAIVSLGMDVKEDVDHLYDDDFIFCPIKGGLKVTVIGNGAKIYVKNPSDNDMNHLFYVSSGSTLFLDNVIVSGFNSAVINYGQLNFNQSRFTDNKINYVISYKDIGGAVRNFGVASFINCTFNDNYANKGAAIYNEGVVKSLDCNYNNNLASLSSKASDRTLGIEHIPIVSTIGNFFNNLGSAVRHVFNVNHNNDIYTYQNGFTYVSGSSVSSLCEKGGFIVKRDFSEPIVQNLNVYDNKSFINVINTVNKDNDKTDVFNITFKPEFIKVIMIMISILLSLI